MKVHNQQIHLIANYSPIKFKRSLKLSLFLLVLIGVTAALTFNDTLNDPVKKGPWVSWYADPAHEVYVVWEGDSATIGKVVYGLSSNNLNLTENDTEPSSIHRLNITGLTSNKKYFYRAYNGEEFAGEGTFQTAPEEKTQEFEWVMVSDPQQFVISPGYHTRIAEVLADTNYAFVTITGDLVYDGSMPKYWNNFFSNAEPYLDNLPFIPVVGNHDILGDNSLFFDYFPNSVSPNYDDLFYYSFDYSMVHFTICQFTRGNTNEMTDEQLDWLRNDLTQAQDQPFRVVMFHCPFWGAGFFASNPTMLDNILPIMHEYNVSAVINGHEHHYERGYFQDPNNESQNEKSFMYMILGGGGGASDVGLTPTANTAFLTATPSFTTVRASLKDNIPTLVFETFTPEGTLIDQAELIAIGEN